MRKISVVFVLLLLLFNLISIVPEPFSISKTTCALRYGPNTDIATADASFIGEKLYDLAGYPVAGVGDVNGDGFDDILIGAGWNSEFGKNTGQNYLIFGKPTGWKRNVKLSEADASFYGENIDEWAGYTFAGAGDVNGDGYDDILIGNWTEQGVPTRGETYLIFGKASNWSMDTSLALSDASFKGLILDDGAGCGLAGVGDVNGDGFDDILIGAPWHDSKGIFNSGKIYLIFGKANGWKMDMTLNQAEASFTGEGEMDCAGYWGVAGAGDVNNDGLDDMLISSCFNDEGGKGAGQVYLILGKTSGWSKRMPLSNVSASFIGENKSVQDFAGWWIDGAGDVNADGYDDIVISAFRNDDNGEDSGKVYIIFGNETESWSMDTNLTNSTTSFVGIKPHYKLGSSVAGVGDVNNDGFDDILIGALSDDTRGEETGAAYLVLGKKTGWGNNTNISTADASFIGEEIYDEAGEPVAGAGDVNGDGFDDIIMGAHGNAQGGTQAGKAYLIFPELNSNPISINSVNVYSDAACENPISWAHMFDTCYIELKGQDGNSGRVDRAFVNINSNSSMDGICTWLLETDNSSGIYRGEFKISNRTYGRNRLIGASIGETIIIASLDEPDKYSSILVSTPVQLRPLLDKNETLEDEDYYSKYWSFGHNEVTKWKFKTNASWLSWNPVSHSISGTPKNDNVGSFWVRLNITDGLGHYDEHNYTLIVHNTLPRILTENLNITLEDQLYFIDYESDDEGFGNTVWNLHTNTSWLTMNSVSGELTGLPRNNDTGTCWVNVSIDDGNSGWNSTNYTLTVIDINDAPMIITTDVSTTFEDELYFVNYDAIDIDDTSILEWYLDTNCSWLEISKKTGVLSGTPNNNDVGIQYVNVTVKDIRNGTDNHNFTLEVLNVNDPPEWINTPYNVRVKESEIFEFNVTATDVDVGDELLYQIKSEPVSDISIDPKTGYIRWLAKIDESNLDISSYYLDVEISVNDSNVTIRNNFDLNVIPDARPTTNLILPENEQLSSASGTELKWEGRDKNRDALTYDIYLSKEFTLVKNLSESACIQWSSSNSSYFISGLEVGCTYYWTVIPFDGLFNGWCTDDIFKFTINTPPVLPDIGVLKATVDDEFRFLIMGTDNNSEDIGKLRYRLDAAPDGLKIHASTGEIFWTPTKEQLGKHTVTVNLSDEKDFTIISFEIAVSQKETQQISGFIGFSLIIFIIIISILITIFLKRRKKADKDKETLRTTAFEDQKRFALTPTVTPKSWPGYPGSPPSPGGITTISSSSYQISGSVQTPSGPAAEIPDPISVDTPPIEPTLQTYPELKSKAFNLDLLPPFKSKMVGRDNEMNVLHTYLLQSKAAQGCTVLVSGEAGIGKTRVVNELINIADLEGFSVLLGNCMYESQTPYMPFLEALKSRELGELLIKDSPRVEAVYLVTPTGLLIKEVVRLETSLDSDIFTSVLTTVSNFVTDSLSTLLKADTEGTLNTLGYEDYRIIIESRKSVNVVAIISGKENEFLIKDLRDIAQKVIENYGSTLQQWDGDEETVMGIENIINPLITSGKYDGMDYSDSGMLARRNRLFENVAKDLTTQTEQKPVLLILEDLQWVDPSSMTLFQYISKSMKTNKILIVGTFRTEEITTTDGTVHPLTKTLELMTSEGLYNKLELHRLPKNLMPEFFSSVLGKVDFSETFIDKFYIETGGNPLFMSELLKFFEEEKIITEHEGIWIEEKDIQNIEIPSKIYNVISRRLNRLDSENRKILDYASVVGVIFNSITLAEALSINESELLEKLKVVEETYKLIQSIDNRYRFDHAMIKEALYNEIPEELRIEYHSLIGQAIEKLNENNLNEVIGDLAFHYYKCRNNEKALKYLLGAADSAKKTFAHDEAVQFYLQAMEIENNEENRKSIHEHLQHILNLKENNGKGLNT